MDHQDPNNEHIGSSQRALEGERTIPSVAARKRPPIVVAGAVLLIAALFSTAMLYSSKGDRRAEATAKREAEIAERERDKTLNTKAPEIDFASVAYAEPAPLAAEANPAPALPTAGSTSAAGDAVDRDARRGEREAARAAERARKEAEELARQRMQASPLAYSKGGSSGRSAKDEALALAAEFGGAPAGAEPSAENGLNSRLKPSKLEGARAGVLPNRNFMLTKGHFLDCTLEQAINSTLAGMVSCRLSNDVYSTNGKVVLLDRGSRITGEYQRGLMKGQARLFVLWTRAETPNGVVVDLDSPGTDALGRSGVDGYINRHFWERFGAAILLSMIDDVGRYAVAKAGSGADDDQIYFTSTEEASQDMATEALKYSIDIPPTLEKNQGGHVSIFVARDLDFSDVYTLASN